MFNRVKFITTLLVAVLAGVVSVVFHVTIY